MCTRSLGKIASRFVFTEREKNPRISLTLYGRMSLKDELLARAALVHHASPMVASQPSRVSMLLECSTGVLLARAACMHHDGQGHDALRHDAVLKGLNIRVANTTDSLAV